MNGLSLRRLSFALAGIAAVLLLVGLSSFGLWDPYEIRVADAARAWLQQGGLGPQLGRPPMPVWWVAAGFKLLGVGELGGRLPIALGSLAALAAAYYAASAFLGKRAALFGTLALATTPGFLLGARSLVTQTPLILGVTLAIGGLARAAWPDPDVAPGRRALDLLLAMIGLVLGQLSAGIVVGVLAPLVTVTVALGLAGAGRAAVSGVSEARDPTSVSVAGSAAVMVLGFSSVAALAVSLAALRTPGYSAVLGGPGHALLHTITVASALPKVGFALFPWVALLPPAVGAALDDALRRAEGEGTPRGAASSDARARFGWLLLVAWAIVVYAAALVQSAAVQETAPPVGPALMLLVGAYLDLIVEGPAEQPSQASARPARPAPFAAFAVALGAVILGRDFFEQPDHFIASHLLEQVRWPGPITFVPYVLMAFALAWSACVGLALLFPLSSDEAVAKQRRLTLVLATAGVAVLFAGVTTFVIVPQVSKHLSARDLYGKSKLLDPKAPVGQYHFNATGGSYYTTGKTPETLATPNDLFTFLARSERVFVMAGSEELPNLEQQSRERKAPYYVVDDSNSRYVMLSNKLGPKEQDLNPLKRFVSETAPKPAYPVEADFEGKVKLIGYDLPQQVDRGSDFKLRLYFQVLQPLGSSYKVFVHFDGPGTRINGDHVPLDGKLPTSNWVPGTYITDEVKVEARVQGLAAPAGTYRLFMGFFLGDTRLKVISGPQDGENRVKLGAVPIK